jgi:hypothetical protein
MVCREDVLAEIEKELDYLLAEAPESLPEAALREIKEESVSYTRHILDALSSKELESPLALERFIETTVAQARLSMHMR